MMDQIRTLKQEELIDSMKLSEFAFQNRLSAQEREERIQLQKAEGIWGYFVDDKLAAKLTILDLQTWIHSKNFAMGGIAGVATWPEYRRKGMVGKAGRLFQL
jgi:predicted acetyltransferase